MHIRDLFVFAVVAISIPTGFRVPFVSLLTFSWLAYMRAPDLCWGFARSARFSYVVAIVMFAGWAFHESTRRQFTRWDVRTRCMLVLFLLVGLSNLCADYQWSYMYRRYLEFGKILLIALFTAGQVTSRRRLKLLCWTVALSLGFFGVKNGIQGILTGGSPILRGPGGLLNDNNDFALALVMTVPLLYYLGARESKRWIRRASWVAIVLTLVTILLTHSRGAFLSLSAVLFLSWWRSRHKLLSAGIAIVGVTLFLLIVPGHVLDRIASIQDYEEDASAMGRIMAWNVAFGMIQDYPLLGVGIQNFRAHFYDYIFVPISWAPVAHNSYLQIWAEAGTISLLVYLLLIGVTFWSLRRLRRLGEATPGGKWILDYARMFEASLLGFVVGASFLNRGHFDLVYHFFGIITAFNWLAFRWAQQPMGQREGDDQTEEREPVQVVSGRGFGERPVATVTSAVGRRPSWGR